MDWIRSKFASQSTLTLPIPSQATIHQKLPWVKKLYQVGDEQEFLDQGVNRVWICERPISMIPGIPFHTDLYFYQKRWKNTQVCALFVSYHGSESRVDLSMVQAKEVNLNFYKKCQKHKFKKVNLNNSKIINKALQLSDEEYNKISNNCNDSAKKLIKELQSGVISLDNPQKETRKIVQRNTLQNKKSNFSLESKSLQELESKSQSNGINVTYKLPIYSVSQFYGYLFQPIYLLGFDRLQSQAQISYDSNSKLNFKCNLQLIRGKRRLSFSNIYNMI